MPTIGPSATQSHQHREMAESFGVDAERYDRARPRYPQGMVDAIVAAARGPDVLDVGCGTGIAARQFQAAGCTVLGVEPDTRMADFARRSGVEVEVATFEAWDPVGRAFDAVISAQTWHWVDPVAGAVKARQALRSGGLLAVFWHVFHLPTEVIDAFAAIFRRVVPDSPLDPQAMKEGVDAYATFFTDKVLDGVRQAGGFGEPEQSRFDWERSYTREELLDLLPSTGMLTRLPEPALAEVLAGVGAAVDAMGGVCTMRNATAGVTVARTGAG